MSYQTLENNVNWKGGRTIASSGYVLVKRPEHPLADCRGYVYEHRLVASEMIGRPLLPAEQVHHRDGDKLNNSPKNLEIMSSLPEHRVFHRRRSDLRLPGQANQAVSCECGCGARFKKFDQYGRPRRFVPGHNTGDRNRRLASGR